MSPIKVKRRAHIEHMPAMEDYQQDDPSYWAYVLEHAAYEDDVETFCTARNRLMQLDALTLKRAINIDTLLVNQSIRCLQELVAEEEKDAILLPRTYLYILGRAMYYNDPSFMNELLDMIESKHDIAKSFRYFEGISYNQSMSILLRHPKLNPPVFDMVDKQNYWMRKIFETHRKAERGQLIRFRASR